MKRNIKINQKTSKSPKQLTKVFSFPNEILPKDGYLSTYAENVFWAGREAITTGKFHDMFMAGDGHELEDFTDENGCIHPAHAKSIYSSSMLAYNFFYWVSPEHTLTFHGTTYDKVYFEVKFPVMAKTSEGRPVNRPSNMDVVLISDDCSTIFCIESKYTEHTHDQAAEFSDAYFKPSCYYQHNPFNPCFIKLALRYNEKKNGYYAGIKQNVSHLIGISNIKYDADALAWFKANNPFIEPEVMEKIGTNTDIYFTNLLYIRPEELSEKFSSLKAVHKNYPTLLGFFQYDYLRQEIEGEFMPYSIFNTYPEFFAKVKDQIPEGLADYLDNRYVLTEHPHFPLPEGYDTADHYLIDVVMDSARVRYADRFTKEVATRIKSELKAIRYRHLADRFLITWDYMRQAHEHSFCSAPGANRTAGSVVAYSLGITDIEPIGAGLKADGLLNRAELPDLFVEFSGNGKEFVQQYLTDKYGQEAASKIAFRDYYVLDIVEQTIATSGDKIDFRTLPYDTPEQLQFFMEDKEWRQYSYFGRADMEKLRMVEHPTLEDMVRIFADRPFRDGTRSIISREHSYARCALFLRVAWLKMHFPKPFQNALEKYHKNNSPIWFTGTIADSLTDPAFSFMIELGRKGIPVAFFSQKHSYQAVVGRILKTLSPPENWEQLEKEVYEIQDKPIYIDYTPNLSFLELQSKVSRLKNEHNIQFVFIEDLDNIGIDLPNYETIKQLCTPSTTLEGMVLGAIITSSYAYKDVADLLRPDVFEEPQNRLIYNAICELADKELPPFIDSVAEQLKIDGCLKQVGGVEYLCELTKYISSTKDLRNRAQILAIKSCLPK